MRSTGLSVKPVAGSEMAAAKLSIPICMIGLLMDVLPFRWRAEVFVAELDFYRDSSYGKKAARQNKFSEEPQSLAAFNFPLHLGRGSSATMRP
jgi:hypothetical protein